MSSKVVLTYADYAALPDDGRRYELHEGELSVMPAPGTLHQMTIGELYLRLRAHVDRHGLGVVLLSPLDIILSEISVVQPDIVFVASAARGVISERGLEGAPTLAVEVLSPSTTRIDRRTKLRLYAQYGVPHYWITDPAARTIEAYGLHGNTYGPPNIAQGDVPVDLPPFTGLGLVPAWLWPSRQS